MNPHTGELIALEERASLPANFDRVPRMLEVAARLKLAEAQARANTDAGAVVNLKSNHPLANWARDVRKEKRLAKIAAKSRKRNRK